MKCLVTGAAGFIASHLAERLVRNEVEVVGLDNFDDYYAPALKRDNICAIGKSDRFHLVEGDIRDADLIKRLFREYPIDRVAHLAARAGVRPSLT